MSTATLPPKKTKFVKRFRIKTATGYGVISRDFHPDGVVVESKSTPPMAAASDFATIQGANAIITRTINAQKAVRESMYAKWPKMQPLLEVQPLEAEPYQIEVDAD